MSNLKKIQDGLKDKGLDALLLLEQKNRFYATGFRSSEGAVVVTPREVFCFFDSRYMEAAKKTISGVTFGLIDSEIRIRDWIKKTVSDCGVKALGIEEESMSYSEYLRLKEELSSELVPAQEIVKKLRQVKSPQELDALRDAQRITDETFEEILGVIKPGMTERELAAEIIYRMLRRGAEGVSFDPIVVAGPKSSMPHGVPGDEKIESGSFVTMDFGCLKHGYCSDMTRTVSVGEPTEEMKKIYNIVLEAQLAGIAFAKPGVIGRDVDGAARDVITKAGYGEYFGHGFGHSLGLDIHETPNANALEQNPLPEGAVISAEPGIYLPGRFGVRIEDVICLTGNGNVNITKSPKSLIVL